jgi:hypothetical protein
MVTMQSFGNKTNKNIEAIYPLSSMQQGMSFFNRIVGSFTGKI